ncbi:MAG: iron-containing alcohol dehydrogenase [Bacteroidetes bacterium]|nr:iron-containing alcohol dehydrogenase [Bacteroidota bacterium]
MWEPQGLYSKFLLKQPTLLFGENSIRGLRNFPCSKVAVIHGKGLTEESKSVFISTFGVFDLLFINKTWKNEPILEELHTTIQILEDFKPDLIIAVGGGAVIDGSKMARLYYEFPFFNVINPKFTYLEWSTKFIAIPTTVGSGSEISSAIVLFNTVKKTKEMIVNHSLLPDVVILDPLFIKGSSEKIILSSSVDALSHIIEGYVSKVENTFSDVYAEKSCQIIYETFSSLAFNLNTTDINRLQFAGYLGGIVQNHCIVGSTHAIAHQLTSFGFSHSIAISLLLTSVIKSNAINLETKLRYDLLAKRCGIQDGIDGLIDFIDHLIIKMDIEEEKNRLRYLIPSLISDQTFIENVQKDKGGFGNPITITEDYIINILNMI